MRTKLIAFDEELRNLVNKYKLDIYFVAADYENSNKEEGLELMFSGNICPLCARDMIDQNIEEHDLKHVGDHSSRKVH